jgi:hypothetical protein
MHVTQQRFIFLNLETNLVFLTKRFSVSTTDIQITSGKSTAVQAPNCGFIYNINTKEKGSEIHAQLNHCLQNYKQL